jgi:ATP-dependent Clp protease ATP-binding subunit ClpC
VIQRDIEDSLTEKLLFGDLNPGSIVVVDVVGEDKEREFTFNAFPRESAPDAPPVETLS